MPSADLDLGSGSEPLAPDAAAASAAQLATGERRGSGGTVPSTTTTNLDLGVLNDPLDNENVLDDASADAYFGELLSHSLDRLSQEPEMLEAEARRARARGLEAALARGKAAFPAAAAALATATSRA